MCLRRIAAFTMVSLAVLAGCSKDTITGPLTSTPTPDRVPTATPTPGVLAGSWSGTMSGCGAITAAVFDYLGGVRIEFTSACYGSELLFVGRRDGETLQGTLTRRRNLFCAERSGPSGGTATASQIRLETARIPDGPSSSLGPCRGVPANTIVLTR